MKRRKLVGTICCFLSGGSTGCLAEDESEPRAEITSLELENHRRDESYAFTIQIEDGGETVFDETHRLDPAGSGNDAIVIDDPVDPGVYSVRVDVDEYSASGETQELISGEQTCLRLQFHLGPETLHMEHQLYDRCE